MPLYRMRDKVFLFIHVPKAAGTTVEFCLEKWRIGFLDRSFNGLYFPCSPQHFHSSIIEKIIDTEKLDFSFSVVRNPIDRIVSEYNFRKKFFGLADDFNSWGEKMLIGYKKDNYIMDNHIRPQCDFPLAVTDIFRVEDGLGEIGNYLSEKLGEEVVFSSSREMKSGGAEQIVIADGLLERLVDFYSVDFKRFGYSI